MADPTSFDADRSYRHRVLWNETAQELGYGLRWYSDGGVPHKIDAGDLFVPVADLDQYGLKAGTPWQQAEGLRKAIERVDKTLEEKRIDNLRKSVGAVVDYPTNPSVGHLTEPERELIRRLSQTLPVLTRLDIVLKDRRGPEFRNAIFRKGDLLGLKQFDRLSLNQCSPSLGRIKGANPAYCSPVDFFPNERPTLDNNFPTELVPADLSEGDREAMAKAFPIDPAYNPYLSPLTSLTRNPQAPAGWSWTKINRDPRFQKEIEQLAEGIAHAAATPGLDPTIRADLLTTVTTLLNDDPVSQYGEDAAWVHQRTGNLEVIVGLEGGYSPMGKVRGATLFLAVERKGAADAFKQNLVPFLPSLEKKLAELVNTRVGRSVYNARPISGDSVVRVVDALAWPGGKPYATLAFVGPDSGPVASQRGLAKRIMVSNHVEAKGEKILLPLAKTALVPEQARYVTIDHFLLDTTAHEMMHPIGPRSDAKLPDGTRAADKIGDGVYNMVEESKSNVGGLVAIAEMRRKGVRGIDEVFLKKAYATYAAGVLRQMRFGGKAHGGGAAAETAFLFREGAMRLKKVKTGGVSENRIEVDFALMEKAVEKLWVHIASLQATGDKEGAEKLVKELPKTMPDAVQTILDRVNAAGIPVDVEMQYPDLTTLFGEPSTEGSVGLRGSPVVREDPIILYKTGAPCP